MSTTSKKTTTPKTEPPIPDIATILQSKLAKMSNNVNRKLDNMLGDVVEELTSQMVKELAREWVEKNTSKIRAALKKKVDKKLADNMDKFVEIAVKDYFGVW